MTEREQFEAWAKKAGWPHHFTSCSTKDPNAYSQESWEVWQAVRAQPAQAVPLLTDDEVALIVADCSASAHRQDDFSFARAIEQAVRDKMGVAGWLPIDTAPNHKTEILLGHPDGGITVGRKAESGNGWDSDSGWIDWPSHWMPLPPPPGIVGKEGA